MVAADHQLCAVLGPLPLHNFRWAGEAPGIYEAEDRGQGHPGTGLGALSLPGHLDHRVQWPPQLDSSNWTTCNFFQSIPTFYRD